MNITQIRNAKINTFEFQKFTPNAVTQAETTLPSINKADFFDKNNVEKPNNWQLDVLKQGLNALENKIQMTNNVTVLDKPENKPIESFEEAIKELRFISPEMLIDSGSKAHSNISHQVVFDLLTEIS